MEFTRPLTMLIEQGIAKSLIDDDTPPKEYYVQRTKQAVSVR
jgi:hypothetical protein